MIRVLNLIDTGGPGGAETVFLHTSTRLNARDFLVLPVISRDGWLAQQVRSAGWQPFIVPSKGSFNLRYLWQLWRLSREQHVDVILAHLYGSAVYACLLGWLTALPVVVVLHGQTDIAARSRMAWLKAAVVRQVAKRVIFVSPRLRTDLQALLPVTDAQARLIPNGVDLARFTRFPDASLRAELELPANALLIGAIGNIREPKDYATFLRAASLLRAADPRYHFVICGEGGNSLHRSLLSLRSELALTDCVSFLGLRTDVVSVLNNLDVYALSSTTEGFSIACIEAMACGVPVVSTRSGGPELIIDDGENGLLVPVRDPAALADGIRRVAEDPAFAYGLVTRALTTVQQRYALPVMLEAYQDCLREVARS